MDSFARRISDFSITDKMPCPRQFIEEMVYLGLGFLRNKSHHQGEVTCH